MSVTRRVSRSHSSLMMPRKRLARRVRIAERVEQRLGVGLDGGERAADLVRDHRHEVRGRLLVGVCAAARARRGADAPRPASRRSSKRSKRHSARPSPKRLEQHARRPRRSDRGLAERQQQQPYTMPPATSGTLASGGAAARSTAASRARAASRRCRRRTARTRCASPLPPARRARPGTASRRPSPRSGAARPLRGVDAQQPVSRSRPSARTAQSRRRSRTRCRGRRCCAARASPARASTARRPAGGTRVWRSGAARPALWTSCALPVGVRAGSTRPACASAPAPPRARPLAHQHAARDALAVRP